MPHDYTPPVSHLLSYGEPNILKIEEWPDYVSELGLTDEHVPQLVNLMTDLDLANFDPNEPPPLPEEADPEVVWAAPVHAWRALYQLAPQRLFDQRVFAVLDSALDEWSGEEFIDIIQAMGPSAIDPVTQLIENNLASENRLTPLIEALYRVGEKLPETRDRIVSILMRLLENYPHNGGVNNSFLAMGLVELKAVEAADLLEKVYEAEEIDEFLIGSWPQVQIELGLKSRSDFTEEELKPRVPPALQAVSEMLENWQRQQKPDAFALGMPLGRSSLPSTKPPDFEDMVGQQNPATPKSKKGFGGSSTNGKKGKKGKKKKR